MTLKLSGIYVITNKVTGDVYVGQSVDLMRRWGGHFRQLTKGTHQNKRLQDDFTRCGGAAFSCRRMELCQPECLCEREAHYVKLFNATYNRAAPPQRIRRDGARFNPFLQELRRWKRQKQRKR
jgi:group I intron endonuclease